MLILKATVEILRPFFKLTKVLSAQKYTTNSIILQACYYLKKKLNVKQTDPILNQFQASLRDSLDFYLKKYGILTDNFLCTSTLLNPEYKDLGHCNEEEKKGIIKRATSFITGYYDIATLSSESESGNDSADSNDSFKAKKNSKNKKKANINNDDYLGIIETELELYLKTPLNDQTYDQFWLSHQGKFPYIARVARMVLTPPATSVPSERVFSAAANQIWARRNRLAASSVEKIMFLLNNLTDELALLILDD